MWHTSHVEIKCRAHLKIWAEITMRIIPHSKPTLGIEERNAVAEVIRSGNIAQGEKVAEFEQAMAEYIGRKYAVAVSSGFAALHLALLALDMPVIVPSYTCKALYYAAQITGREVLVLDETEPLSSLGGGGFSAAILPHTFGFVNYNMEYEQRHDVKIPDNFSIIEDCATAIGGMHDGKMLGSFGEISVFSFYATKMITTGEGGMVLTDDFEISEKVRCLRDYTIDNVDDGFVSQRFNYKMTDMAAAMGIVQLGRLSEFIWKRWDLSLAYNGLLKSREGIRVPIVQSSYTGDKPAFHRYIVRLKNHVPDTVIAKMKSRGIMCGYGVKQPLHRILKLDPKDFPDAEKLANEVISLPLYPSLTMDDVKYIVKNFLEVLVECE